MNGSDDMDRSSEQTSTEADMLDALFDESISQADD